ncbi:hypothetical protein CLV84_0588 [Neolewinella xylanilytica]|uniref:Uncharacterized protein n=2 Tax=Neolewinella xylanilytica TaxID=1514080 RepID=A0A2S6I821_9BACT|nr:hypothetical protein CLV84_0588 [Neolewinella xylanilytica]
MLVGVGLLIIAGVLVWVHPGSAVLPALAGGGYLYLGYHLRNAASRQIVVFTAIVYAVWLAYGPLVYQVRMSPGILIGILPGSLDLSFDVALQAAYNATGDAPPALGFDLLALIILFYLVDQYPFVPEYPARPPEDIPDADSRS